MSANRFKTGSGVYRCRWCSHNTRDTGGDGSNMQMCDLCFDLCGEENHLSDTGRTYSTPESVKGMLSQLDKRNGSGTADKLFSYLCEAVKY